MGFCIVASAHCCGQLRNSSGGRSKKKKKKQQQPGFCFLAVSHVVCFHFPLFLQQQKNLEGYVGFASLPNQVYRKSVKRGFEFTLMVVGKNTRRCVCLCFYMNRFIVFIVVGILQVLLCGVCVCFCVRACVFVCVQLYLYTGQRFPHICSVYPPVREN